MNNLLTEAKLILASNKSDKAARDFMITDQRNAMAEGYAAKKQFLSASHFHSDADRTQEFKRMFWENISPTKGN